MSEAPVTFQDQNRINKFSSNSVAQAFLEDRYSTTKKLLEANQDAIEELELVLDEDVPIPCRYGDIFIMSSIDSVKERCQREISEGTSKVQELAEDLQAGKEQLAELKGQLYTKFGDAIRLDYD